MPSQSRRRRAQHHPPPASETGRPDHRADPSVRDAVAALPEGILLVLLVALPSFVNLATLRIFEEEKALLLQAAGLLSAAAMLCRPGAWALPGAWRAPVLTSGAALIAALALSSLFAMDRADALAGAYYRHHGLATWLALGVMTWAGVVVALRPRGRAHLLTAALLGSVWPSAYALVQATGLDPLMWTRSEAGRAGSTLGNPVLLGGYLCVVIPATCAAMLRRWSWGLLLLLQLAALAATGSRGPLLATLCGLLVCAAAAGPRVSRRGLGTALTVAAFAAVTLGATAWATGQFTSNRFTTAGGASLQIRFSIWQGVVHLMRDSGGRAILGWGPDQLAQLFPPYYRPEIGRLEGSDAMPDRAHNEWLDTLVSSGLVGLTAELVWFAALGLTILRVRDRLLRAGLLGAVVAHLVEIQVGIATVSSRLVVLTCAAIAMGADRDRDGEPLETPGPDTRGLAVVATVGALTLPVTHWAFLTLSSALSLDRAAAWLPRVTPLMYLSLAGCAAILARHCARQSTAPQLPRRALTALALAAACATAIPLCLTPSSADSLARLGQALEDTGRWHDAGDIYERAAQTVPMRPTYWTSAGRAWLRSGLDPGTSNGPADLMQSEQSLRRALALSPRDPNAARNLASYYRTVAPRRPEASGAALIEADALYETATRLAPGLPTLWAEWANVALERRSPAEATRRADQAIALDAERYEPWLLRGHARLFERNLTGAITDYDRAIALAPSNVAALRSRAIAEAALGRLDRARLDLETALRIAPSDSESLRLQQRLDGQISTAR